MIFRLINAQVVKNCIDHIKNTGAGKFQIEIKPLKRSAPQNAYYWVIVGVIAGELGYSSEELHDAFKRKFIGINHGVDFFGNGYLQPKESKGLTKEGFTVYMNKVLAFAHSEGIKLPTPDYYGITERK